MANLPATDGRHGPDGPAAAALTARAAFLASLREQVGTRIGLSGWTVVDQARIDRFAEATGDHQFVHVDPVRAAAETPFGGTVAHGYLTLSMLGAAIGEVLPANPAVRAVLNMGADKVRFLTPVRVNAQVRAAFTLNGVSALPENRAAMRLGVTVDVADAGETRPALSAELTLILVLADEAVAAQAPEQACPDGAASGTGTRCSAPGGHAFTSI